MLQAATKKQPRMAQQSEDKTTLQVSSLERPLPKPQHILILPRMQLTKPQSSERCGSTCWHGNRAEFCHRPGDLNGLQNEPTRASNGGYKASPICTTQVNGTSNLRQEDRHRYKQVGTKGCNRCTAHHRGRTTKQFQGSLTAPQQGNDAWVNTTFLHCLRGHHGDTCQTLTIP